MIGYSISVARFLSPGLFYFKTIFTPPVIVTFKSTCYNEVPFSFHAFPYPSILNHVRSQPFFSKVSVANVRECISELLKYSEEHKRKFTETVELQVGLKNYDTQRDKRFNGSIR